MLKKLFITTSIAIGLIFIVTGSEKPQIKCTITETQECWQLDSEKGWIYQAPEISVSPAETVETWSFDEEKGWIFQADEITVIG
ncbi:MAG: hypothetical protein ACE5D7_10245 [Fidelibacterota bacterium]